MSETPKAIQATQPQKYSAEYYAQMLGGETIATPEDSITQKTVGQTALEGVEATVENTSEVVRAGQPVVVERPAPIIITHPGPQALRQAGFAEGGFNYGLDPSAPKE